MKLQSNDVEQPAPRRAFRMRWWMWPLVLLGFAVAALGVWRYAVHRRVEQALAKIRADGLPATAAELDAWYPSVEPADNAALVIEPAAKQAVIPDDDETLMKLPWLSDAAPKPKANQPVDADTLKQLRKVLADNQAVLAKLHEAAAMKGSRYPIQLSKGFGLMLPHLTDIRTAGNLLAVEAVVNAEAGDGDAAVRANLAMLAMARSLRDEPTVISQLVRATIVSTSVGITERLANRVKLSDAAIGKLRDVYAEIHLDRGVVRALSQERAAVSDVFDLPLNKLSQMLNDAASVPGYELPQMPIAVYRASGLIDIDHLAYLTLMQRQIDAIALPRPDRPAAFAKIDVDFKKLPAYSAALTKSLGVVLDQVSKADNLTTASVGDVRVGLAILQMRRAEHRLPDRLVDLVPRFIDKLPADPFNGKALHYVRYTGGAGFTVYSVGDDLVDDGGVPDASGSDVTFEVDR